MRLLGAVRLSSLTDETTSPERQREQIELYAKLHGHELVGITEDLDVSGATSPFTRDGLGPWLTDPAKVNSYDLVCTSKLERLTRDLRHFDDFRHWCDTHGKTYASATEPIDLTSPTGRMVANMLAMFAQFQRERNAELRAEAAATLRKAAQWGGGVVPFGYEAYKDGVRWYLRPCGDDCPLGLNLAGEIQKMAEAVIAGTPVAQIVAELNNRHVPTSSDAQKLHAGKEIPASDRKRWEVTTVLKLLRSEYLMGYVMHYRKGETPKRVYADGVAVKREPLLEPEVWEQVQAALSARSAPWKRTGVRSSLISGIAVCAHCKAPLRKSRSVRYTGKGKSRTVANDGQGYNYYYQCANMRDRDICPDSRSIPMDELDAAVNEMMMVMADEPFVTTKETPGQSSALAVDKVERELRELDFDSPDFIARQSALLAKRAELQAQPYVPATVTVAPDGRTFGQVWEAMDTAEKRNYMTKRGIDIHAARQPDGFLVVTVGGGNWPDDVAELGGVSGADYMHAVMPWQWGELKEAE